MLTALLFTLGIAAATSFNATAIDNQNNKNKLPDIGISGYSVLSTDKELQIGKAMMRQLRGSQPLIQDPVLIEYINHLGNTLVKNAQGVNYAFEFFLINNNELNAFAFFGGHVGIHSGLITTADTESELASVIAHEISHVTQRHLARRLESQSQTQGLSMAAMLSSVLITLVNPSVGIAALSASMAVSQQASINYTRGNEKEADRVGIALLASSNFDPQGAASFFSKMSTKYRYASKPPAMLLTHPLPESRIADARQRALNYPARPLPPSLGFELTKARL
ncbi:MAG TPA: peptidase M48, partial [Colwellia sp.]|nr:peptidase M48 [Colwellia sp.]